MEGQFGNGDRSRDGGGENGGQGETITRLRECGAGES